MVFATNPNSTSSLTSPQATIQGKRQYACVNVRLCAFKDGGESPSSAVTEAR